MFLTQIRQKLLTRAALILLETKRRGFGNGWQQLVNQGECCQRHEKDAVGEGSAFA